jgi:hypothetical protein
MTTKREGFEAEVKRIKSPLGNLIIIEKPDGTELPINIRAISFPDFKESTEVLAGLIHGMVLAGQQITGIGKALTKNKESEDESPNTTEKGNGEAEVGEIVSREMVQQISDKLFAFLPWVIKVGTDKEYDDIKDLDYITVLEIVTAIISFNFGERLLDFILRAVGKIGPIIMEANSKYPGGLTSKPPLSATDMTEVT